MSKMLTYLQLSEEFGGTRFGPIKLPEYRLGSAEGNEVQLAEGLGVEPFHVRMIRKSNDTFYLAPVERSAAVWLYRAGHARPELLHGPTVIRPGDGFALVTPEGVRFTVTQQEEHKPKRRSGSAGGLDEKGMGDSAKRYGNRVVQEVWRRVRAAALATYVGRMMQNTWFFVKTGQIFSPLYVIGFLLMFSGWGASFRSCSKQRTADTKLAAVELDHEDCQTELEAYRGGTNSARLSLGQLTARIHGDRSWEGSLEWSEATDVMTREISNLLGPGATLDRTWFTGSGNPYSVLVKRLTQKGLPEPAARVLAWSGVNPYVDLSKRRKMVDGAFEIWDMRRTNAEAYRQCIRGPLRLSYVQASRLGITAAEDAFFDRRTVGKIEGVVSDENRKTAVVGNIIDAFNAQRGAMSLPPDLEDINRDTVNSVTLPEGSCFFRTRDDSRGSLGTAAGAVATRLGMGVSGLPGEGQTNWITARLALLFLYELDGNDWSSLDLNSRHLDAEFAALSQRDSEGAEHVSNAVGRILALATAVPCMILLDKGADSYPEIMGEAPDFDACAILTMRAQYNEL